MAVRRLIVLGLLSVMMILAATTSAAQEATPTPASNQPVTADDFIERGNLFLRQGMYEASIQDYSNALEMAPDNGNIYNNRGIAYAFLGEYTLAIADYNRTIELDPGNASAHVNRGNAYFHQFNYRSAISNYTRSISLRPDDAIAYNNRGVSFARQGQYELAIADYDHAIELDPNMAIAYSNRGAVYAETGNIELARVDQNRALELDADFAAAYDHRAGFVLCAACEDELLNRLTISGSLMSTTLQMQPGETQMLSLGLVECCYYFEPVPVSATWLVEPNAGATINAATGELTIDGDTPSGSIFTVRANIENGRHIVTVEVHVYTPAAKPLVGSWSEDVQLACDTVTEISPIVPIGELVFRADGTFSVTWMPFEIYKDYWGIYTYDPAQTTLVLSIEGGNYIPNDLDLSGTVEIDASSRLVLSEMWLGSPQSATIVDHEACQQRFRS
jgi:Tfp pilus assembly protein PilF